MRINFDSDKCDVARVDSAILVESETLCFPLVPLEVHCPV